MTKQKFTCIPLSLGIISILLGSFVAFPYKANAGKDVIPGTTSGSDSTIGDTFSITTEVTTTVDGITIGSTSADGSLVLIVKPAIQTALNTFATTFYRDTNVSSIRTEVRELFTRSGRNVVTVTERIKTNWVRYGVSEVRINSFLMKLSECITVIGDAESSDPVVVDVSKLSAAIDEYNLIVKESNSSTIQQLSQDETFTEISKILKEFRATLKTVS